MANLTTKGINFTKHSDDEIALALRESHGLINLAAKKLGLKSAGGLRTRIKNSSELNKILVESREEILDLAESKMIEKVEKGDSNMVQFVLRHLGSQRGYVDETHITGSVTNMNLNANFDFDLSVLTVEELIQLEQLRNKITISNTDTEDSL